MIKNIKQKLKNSKSEKYKEFTSSLLPGVDNILGVKMPTLRKMADIVATSDYKTFFSENDNEYLELTLLEGMAIGRLKIDFPSIMEYVEKFIPKINCWSVCDTFCAGLKIVKKHREEFKLFLEKYFNSKEEFEIRFVYVILLTYFIEYDYDYVIKKLSEFNNEAYYAKMAAAWCLSICFIKNYEQTKSDIQRFKIHPWVLNKGIVKATESLRLSEEQKKELRNIKQNFQALQKA